MFAKMISDMMIKPGKSPVFETPTGFDYEDVEFQTKDGVTLRGWLIKGGTDKVIIQSHFGVQCSRAGYTPKEKGLIKMWKEDISFLRQAKYFVELGYSVLMYDLRNHGESDTGSCPWISWGPEEAKDVVAAVDYIANHTMYSSASIGLLSICMGACSTTYAYGMGDDGLRPYENIKAMVAIQPLHYNEFVQAFGIPGFLDRWGNKLSTERLGFDLKQKSFIDDVQHISVPTLVVQNRNDPWTKLEFVEDYFNRLKCEKEMLWQDLEKNRAAAYDEVGRNPKPAADWFAKWM